MADAAADGYRLRMTMSNAQAGPGNRPDESGLPSDKFYVAPNRDVERRAAELAVLRGRETTDEDRADARRELRGETESVSEEADGTVQELISASRDPSDPTVSLGKIAPANMSAEEDENGLRAEIGVDQAQHELMLAARRDEVRANREANS